MYHASRLKYLAKELAHSDSVLYHAMYPEYLVANACGLILNDLKLPGCYIS